MKILQINRNHFVDGGADRVYLNTGALLERKNNEVIYFSTANNRNLDSSYSEYFVNYSNPTNKTFIGKLLSAKTYLYNKNAYHKLENLIINHRPDVAHLHLFYGVLSSSILYLLSKYKIPIVITIHDYRLLCPVNAMLDNNSKICEKCGTGNYYNCILKKCSKNNLFNSGIVSLEAYLRKSIFDPIKYINHFIFVSQFSQLKHVNYDLRYKTKSSHLFNFSNKVIPRQVILGDYLLYYGRLSKEKGILNLINAAVRTNSKLKIVGDGPQKDEIISIVKNHKGIDFLGYMSGLELETTICNCSFVVVPSEWYENNPMTVVEAFSNGKPVIGSEIGGIPEMVSTNTGFLFEYGNVDSLTDILNIASVLKIEEYNRLSINCLNFAKKYFDEDVHFKKLMQIYQSAIKNYEKPY